MQQRDVRRSDQMDEAVRAEPESPKGSSRSFFRLGGGKQTKRVSAELEQGRLHDRLREVLERDRALADSQPELRRGDEAWSDPFGDFDPELHTGTRARESSEFDEPFGEPTETGTRTLGHASSEERLAQIARWIEEELTGLPALVVGPLDFAREDTERFDPTQPFQLALSEVEAAALEAELSEDEAAELSLDAALSEELSLEAVRGQDEDLPTLSNALLVEEDDAEVTARTAEPINTRTMARLFASQGYKPRALAIYRELLELSPDDEALRAELEALQRRD